MESFLTAYERLAGRRFRREGPSIDKPDYRVVEPSTRLRFGVELTSVYLDDRSVPDEHIPGVPEGTLRDLGYDAEILKR